MAAVLGAAAGTASAAASYPDSVVGAELPTATSTRGTFVGVATGALPGRWRVQIEHAPLASGSTVAVTGGSFSFRGLDGRAFSGRVTGGSVTVQSRGVGCTDQRYAVDAQFAAGWFQGMLTHHRRLLFGRCLIYAATVRGSATFSV